ncbi:septum formation protein Maf [Mariprofundus sp. EBB-1]|uniref:Maf family protein n=1 Tax=Mariprofundus sp. EBB-1 TaxID=2650971 RepID=UPI000EF186FD|nr:Maf family protein [Mariprofundus sp. EBB-1]RLL51080.1 septum formation protein Maf [Mariprofundus sp. EBB-1]
MRLILASSSPYRRELLQRLGLVFEQVSPDFVEACPGSMPAAELVQYNTLGKAHSLLSSDSLSVDPDVTIIASDQIAVCGSTVLGKPGSIENACAQLAMLSGRSVTFLTGLSVLSRESEFYEMIPFKVHFRHLSTAEIDTYVAIEKPLNCAGSFKSEGLGISLFDRLEGDDPTALIGLPLIRLSQCLQPLSLLATKVTKE